MKTKLLIVILILVSCISNGQQKDGTSIIKVLSFNIYHGENTQGESNLDTIVALINKLQPDFVGLQEVDVNTQRSNHTDISTLLAYKTNMFPLFAKAIDFSGGEYGVALLSKHSFINTHRQQLPNTVGNEPRVLAGITTTIHQQNVHILNTHFDHQKNEKLRVKQAEFINTNYATAQVPKILIGDLNALPNSKPIILLETHWKSAYSKEHPAATYPSDSPTEKIDYIMVYPKNKWKILESTVINTGKTSDHLAYFVTLQLL